MTILLIALVVTLPLAIGAALTPPTNTDWTDTDW